MKMFRKTVTLVVMTVLAFSTVVNAQTEKVVLQKDDANRKVDVMIGDQLFTSYQYPADMEKPYLFPVFAPNGSDITRGYPLKPRAKERVDHPHHIGLWFNHGNVNGLDFWNNSSAIPAARKASYGHIVVTGVTKAKSGKKAVIEVVSEWRDNDNKALLEEHTQYIISATGNTRTIDHISTLTALVDKVTFTDNKEGMIAIRVDRAFEMPSNAPAVFTDEHGVETTVRQATDNTGITGNYFASSGKQGEEVWSTRNDWVMLTGTKDNTKITFGFFDHPNNIGYPFHSHARGYGLFASNNLGSKSYNKNDESIAVDLAKGESLTLRHRFFLQSGAEITPAQANAIFADFSKLYTK